MALPTRGIEMKLWLTTVGSGSILKVDCFHLKRLRLFISNEERLPVFTLCSTFAMYMARMMAAAIDLTIPWAIANRKQQHADDLPVTA